MTTMASSTSPARSVSGTHLPALWSMNSTSWATGSCAIPSLPAPDILSPNRRSRSTARGTSSSPGRNVPPCLALYASPWRNRPSPPGQPTKSTLRSETVPSADSWFWLPMAICRQRRRSPSPPPTWSLPSTAVTCHAPCRAAPCFPLQRPPAPEFPVPPPPHQ